MERRYETVFFLRDLTVEEEHRIINNRYTGDPEQQIINANRKYVQRTSGNIFYKGNKELYEQGALEYKPLDKRSVNRLNSLLTALCFLDPLRNFIENMAAKIEDKIFDIPAAEKIFDVIDYFKGKCERDFPVQRWSKLDVGISPQFASISCLFDELLRVLHEDILRRYKFVEDAWEDSDRDVKAKTKHIHSEFSPIVDIFHLKVKKFLSDGKTIGAEHVNSLEIDCSTTGIREHFEIFSEGKVLEKGKSIVIKHPHIQVLKFLNSDGCKMPDKISLSGKKYALKSMVALCEGKYVTCVRSGAGFIKMGVNVSELKRCEGISPLLAFYVATNYEFD